MAARASQERPGHVRAKHLLEARRREIDEGALAADSGIEDERIEAAEVGHRFGNGALGVRLAARVGDDRETAQFLCHLVDRALPPARDRDVVAVGGQAAGDSRADARAPAGDERDPGHRRRSLTISWSSTV